MAQVVPPTSTRIKPDTSLPHSTQFTQSGTTFTITDGTRSGSNLFHSFDQFTIKQGDTALFSNVFHDPSGRLVLGPSTSNILSRVTGGRSDIFGEIKTDANFGAANLFLIDPAGIIFGPKASLNVGGAFRASTANYVTFGPNEPTFSSKPVPNEIFSAAPPVAFGFLGPTPPVGILVQGLGFQPDRLVPSRKALSLLSFVGGEEPFLGHPATGLEIAGPVTTGPVNAPGGEIQIVSIASKGEVPLSRADLSAASFQRLGQINLSQGALLDVSGSPAAGTVVIRGGRLVMDGAAIQAFTLGNGVGGGVKIRASSMEMRNGAFIESGTVCCLPPPANLQGKGSGGDISVNVETLTLMDNTTHIKTLSNGDPGSGLAGPAGTLEVIASSSVAISGDSNTGLFSTTSSKVATGIGGPVIVSAPSLTVDSSATIATAAQGTAPAGGITITVGDLSLTRGGSINSSASGSGSGGTVTVRATDSALISGTGSGIFSLGSTAVTDIRGAISANFGQLTLTGGGAIQSGSHLDQSTGGNVRVKATDSIIISAGGSISSQNFGSQNVGQLSISAPTLLIDDGSITTSTFGTGDAGPLSLSPVGRLTLVDGGQIASSSGSKDFPQASGRGGNMTVTTTGPILISGKSSGLFSTASGTGPAGQIVLSAPGLTLSDGGTISVGTSGPATAPAGSIALNLGSLSLTGFASIDSGTTGAGHGGNVTVTASDGVTASSSAVVSNATAGGAGGSITIQTPQLQLTAAVLSATSSGTGDAGNIKLGIGDTASLNNSSITTSARTADGGDISLTGGDLVYLLRSGITTSVGTGSGKGGNITIDPQFVVLDHSGVRADAFGGPGGHINIVSDFFLTNKSVLSASSALSTQGTVAIQSTFTNLSNGLAPLPSGLAQVATLLRASCATRVAAGKASSLVVAGREGLPLEPGGYIPSPLMVSEAVGDGPASGEIPDLEGLPRLSLSVFVPSCLR